MVAAGILLLPSTLLLCLVLVIEVVNFGNFLKAHSESTMIGKGMKMVGKFCFLGLVLELIVISIYSEMEDMDLQMFLNLGLLGMVLIIVIVISDILKLLIDKG